MSRGPGHVMRELEQRLTERPMALARLARSIYGTQQPTPAQMESIRRAAARLVELGRAERQHVSRWVTTAELDGQGFPIKRRHDSWLRTPRTPEEIERDRAEAEAFMRARGLG